MSNSHTPDLSLETGSKPVSRSTKPYVRNAELSDERLFPAGMQRIALGIEYAGHFFHGFQAQPHDPQTIQQGIEQALSDIGDEAIQLVCAGRTDAGVHATGQVIHFDAANPRTVRAWLRGVNSLTPRTINLAWVVPVDPEFHARFSATGRRYQYWLSDRPVPPAVGRGLVAWSSMPELDVAAMHTAAQALLGEQDFSSFRGAACQSNTPFRCLTQAQVRRHGSLVVFEFSANAFLLHMVRNLVGSLVQVGRGRRPGSWLADVLTLKDRTQAGPTAAPEGLYLVGVDYAPSWGLPQDEAPGVALPF